VSVDDYTAEAFKARMAAIVKASIALEGPSLAQRLAESGRLDDVLDRLYTVDPLALRRLLYDWRFWGRPKQQPPPGEWDVWITLAGRGWGKTRTGAEWVIDGITSGECFGAILIGPTFDDTRKYMVGGVRGRVRGGSGILDCAPPWLIPDPQRAHKQTHHEIHCSNGAVIYYTSAEKPELRGANLSRAWCDELCIWPHAERLWDNLMLTLREKGGGAPHTLITTTPQPMDLLRDVIMDEATATVHGVTTENAANVHRRWLERIQRKLGGTRLGRQELEAEVLGDVEGALFARAWIDAARVDEAPKLRRMAVAVDPALSTSRYSDQTGIVVMGVDALEDLYVLDDLTGRHKPEAWGTLVVQAARDWDADVVVERTAGGQLVAMNVRAAEARMPTDATGRQWPAVKIVEIDARGRKDLRAQPVATLCEQGRIHFVGRHRLLEAEITEWVPHPKNSPNRLDAMVHGANLLCGDLTGRPNAREAFEGLEMVRERLKGQRRPGPRVSPVQPARRRGRSTTRI